MTDTTRAVVVGTVGPGDDGGVRSSAPPSRGVVATLAVLLTASLGMGIALASVRLTESGASGESGAAEAPAAPTLSTSASSVVPSASARDLSAVPLTQLFPTVPATWTKVDTQAVPTSQVPSGIQTSEASVTDWKDAAGRTLAVVLLRVPSDAAGTTAVRTYVTGVPGAGPARTSATPTSSAVSGTKGSTSYGAAGLTANGVVSLILVTSSSAVPETEVDGLVAAQDSVLR